MFFLAKPGNEIGKYIDEKVLLYNNYNEKREGCLTEKICNDDTYCITNHKLIKKNDKNEH